MGWEGRDLAVQGAAWTPAGPSPVSQCARCSWEDLAEHVRPRLALVPPADWPLCVLSLQTRVHLEVGTAALSLLMLATGLVTGIVLQDPPLVEQVLGSVILLVQLAYFTCPFSAVYKSWRSRSCKGLFW